MTMTCTRTGCTRRVKAVGLCAPHYEQHRALNATPPPVTTCERCGALIATHLLAAHGRWHTTLTGRTPR